MISFIIGLFVGSFLGVALMALLAMARDPEPPKREPAKLWTKGNLCKWGGKICEITDFSTRANNDTIALIEWKSNGHNYKVWLPIEELEAVEEWQAVKTACIGKSAINIDVLFGDTKRGSVLLMVACSINTALIG